VSFFRTLLGSGLKENRFLYKAVITGVLRVARESLFSGVNHLELHSMLSGQGFADTFGFNQAEVEQLAASAGLGDREVRSNQELGYGRADVTVRPRVAGRPGVVIELKKLEPGKTVQGTLRAAMAQIKRRDYAAGLRGIAEPIYRIAIVFEGKRAHVKMGPVSAPPPPPRPPPPPDTPAAAPPPGSPPRGPPPGPPLLPTRR
jgi:hypothetical protein